MDHGSERERRVGDAAGDDDLRAETQRLGDRERAEVDVGAFDLRADGGERLAGIHVLELDAALQE